LDWIVDQHSATRFRFRQPFAHGVGKITVVRDLLGP